MAVLAAAYPPLDSYDLHLVPGMVSPQLVTASASDRSTWP